MKKRTKLVLGGMVAITGALLLSGCTQSFCSHLDQGRMLYAFDPGVTRYKSGGNTEDIITDEFGRTFTLTNFEYEFATWESDNYRFVLTENKEDDITYLTYLNNVIASSRNNGFITVGESSLEYFKTMDSLFLKEVAKAILSEKGTDVTYDLSDKDSKDVAYGFYAFQRQVSYYSYLKYVANEGDTLWANYTRLDAKARETLNEDICPSSDFAALLKSTMISNMNAYRTCLTTRTDKYGNYGFSTNGVFIEQKSWSYAWNRGFFEGLLVYPIGWLIDKISFGFQDAGVANGWAALLAILFVTLIVRTIMMAATIKQTTGSAKMAELQPEIQKIQNKYPNSNTNNAEKQRMAEEMNRLYKKNKINPFTSILVMIVQFPVFICVWGALSGSATLASGTVLGLDLSLGIRQVLFVATNWSAVGGYSAVTALFLFLLMAGAQTVSMLLPQWIQKAKAKKVARLGKNPAQKQQDNRMKIFTYVMLAMIIFMGFSLVSAMGVYWFIGAILSIIQTLITQSIMAKSSKKK